MTTKHKKGLSVFREVCDVLRKEVDDGIFLQTAYILTLIADNQDIPMSELSRLSGLSQAGVSRNVAQLSRWTRHRTEGYGLVEAYEDPMERRRKLVRLTKEGEALVKKLRVVLC